MKKQDLPSKLCAGCGRPFSWRRKWARDWEAVKYCSDACRTGKYATAKKAGANEGVTPLVKNWDVS